MCFERLGVAGSPQAVQLRSEQHHFLCRSRHLQAGGRRPASAFDHPALPRPGDGHPRRARRPRPSRPIPDRLGQDARLRRAAGRPDRARRSAARRPWSSPRPASSPARSSTSSHRWPRPARLRIAAVYGGVGFGPQIAAAQPRRHPRRHPGPARGPDRARRGLAGADPRPRPRRGRPDARHGLPPRRRPDRRRDPARSPDPLLLGDPRGRRRHASPPPTPATPAPTPTPSPSGPRPTSSTTSSRSSRRAPSSTTWSSTSAEGSRGRSLVFVRTKRGADRLVKRLRGHNVEAVAMHGDKSQRQRERALARFERGEVMTLVATDVAARGIDVADVARVDQLRRPRGSRRLRAPGRPHRPSRTHRHRHQLRPRRSGRGDAPDRSLARPGRRLRIRPGRRRPGTAGRAATADGAIAAGATRPRPRRDRRSTPSGGVAPAATSPRGGSTAVGPTCPAAGPSGGSRPSASPAAAPWRVRRRWIRRRWTARARIWSGFGAGL